MVRSDLDSRFEDEHRYAKVDPPSLWLQWVIRRDPLLLHQDTDGGLPAGVAVKFESGIANT